MRILLDTSYLYDLIAAPGKFSDVERRFFAEQEARIYVSAVSVWEMRLKYRACHPSGKRKSPFDPNDVIAVLEGQDVILLPMTMSHAGEHSKRPIDHKDPFDELLLVQAQEEGLKLLTADSTNYRSPTGDYAIRGSDSNGAKSHVKGRSWDRLASQDLSPSVSQGTIWRYVAGRWSPWLRLAPGIAR